MPPPPLPRNDVVAGVPANSRRNGVRWWRICTRPRYSPSTHHRLVENTKPPGRGEPARASSMSSSTQAAKASSSRSAALA